MARSDYIYVVEQRHPPGIGEPPVAAFTVKWELCVWLYKYCPYTMFDINVFRVPDSYNPNASPPPPTKMNPYELQMQGYERWHKQWERTLREYRGPEPEAPQQ